MIRKLGSVIIFIACFFCAKYLVQYGMGEYRESKAISAVDAQYSEMEREAETSNSGAPKSVAIQEVAIRKSEENINSQNSPLKKRKAALSIFMGFYLVNHRARGNFCRSLGVDISTFSNKFKALHQAEISLSQKLVFRNSGDIDKLYKMLKPQLEKVVKQDMADISKAYEVTLTDACELMEQNGAAFAQEMLLSKIQPSVYKAIHGAN